MVYTYPVTPAAAGNATPADLQAFLASPTLIARRMAELVDESRFIGYYLLSGRYQTVGNAIAYQVTDTSVPKNLVETIAAGAEYPLVPMTPEQIRTAEVAKRGHSSKITDEAVTQQGAQAIDNGLTYLANGLIRDFDTTALGVVASSVTKTVAASSSWATVDATNSGARAMIADVLRAKAQVADIYSPDTLVLPELMYASLLPSVLPLLPRESSFVTDGGFVSLAGIDIVTSPFASSLANPILLDRAQLGGIAKGTIQSPGYSTVGQIAEVKTWREEGRDATRLQARSIALPIVTNPGAGVVFTGTGL